MNLYLLEHPLADMSPPAVRWEGFRSVVAAAETEEDARMTHPRGYTWGQCKGLLCWNNVIHRDLYWPPPSEVSVRLLGTAAIDIKAGDVFSVSIFDED